MAVARRDVAGLYSTHLLHYLVSARSLGSAVKLRFASRHSSGMDEDSSESRSAVSISSPAVPGAGAGGASLGRNRCKRPKPQAHAHAHAHAHAPLPPNVIATIEIRLAASLPSRPRARSPVLAAAVLARHEPPCGPLEPAFSIARCAHRSTLSASLRPAIIQPVVWSLPLT